MATITQQPAHAHPGAAALPRSQDLSLPPIRIPQPNTQPPSKFGLPSQPPTNLNFKGLFSKKPPKPTLSYSTSIPPKQDPSTFTLPPQPPKSVLNHEPSIPPKLAETIVTNFSNAQRQALEELYYSPELENCWETLFKKGLVTTNFPIPKHYDRGSMEILQQLIQTAQAIKTALADKWYQCITAAKIDEPPLPTLPTIIENPQKFIDFIGLATDIAAFSTNDRNY